MAPAYDSHWTIDDDYYGQIIHGDFSPELKKYLIAHLAHFLAFDRLGHPAIPYISAWHDQQQQIWYEFAGRRFMDLLACRPSELATKFSQSIIERTIYRAPLHALVEKEIIPCDKLGQVRPELRAASKRRGTTEAVYKLRTPQGRTIWLKDQATIEIHSQDHICLSLGMLFNITKEMRAEEELKRAKEEIKQHHDHLEELVAARTKELWKTQLEIVHRLARAAEFKDLKTGQHITKMSHYCAILSQALGLGANATELLFHATPMHDIGKIGIADRILLKPGKLDAEEFKVMKEHSAIGASLLSGHDSSLLKVAKTIALNHHERWDGSGYPRGLSAQQIPLAGRIAAICDVFDALTSERPYKKAWPFDHAVRELQQAKGSHFDPRLVELFIQNLPRIKKIHAQENSRLEVA